MFDIRTAAYLPDQDSGRLDFWKLNTNVVASFHTLREDKDGRHDRMLQTDPWDLIIVDEAHHLNVDEASGMTLAHRLIKKLQEADRLRSLLFFTGTPHRGKHFGFLALMSLVRPDLFDPRKPVEPQLARLPEALVRNNKYHVTNLRGERLFKEPQTTTVPYRYNSEEDIFYKTMTEFIASGQAYASGLQGDRGRTVMLVLIALQKLASSSVAAVRSALQKRLKKLTDLAAKIQGKLPPAEDAAKRLARYGDDPDAINPIVENEIVTLYLELMNNECARLAELIATADKVTVETKIEAIITRVRQLPPGESVLFFTEYKVTQAVLLAALWQNFGDNSASFINGDEALPSVVTPTGTLKALRESRQSAKDRFNSGKVRFLVSTEAAGEGIDLQERCSRLIHVDLPWNPMRLHQRVGRLNRIGQQEVVKVMLFQNPDTVESRIWTLLNEKLERIRRSINAVAEEPEDLHQLVLGIARPGMLDAVFATADQVPRAKLEDWFNEQTGQMGGEDAVRVVQDLLGHAQHFDFAQVSDKVPKLDLPDLAPFFRLSMRHNRRQVTEIEGQLAFKTPDSWQKTPGLRARYEDVHFNRKSASHKKGTLLGIGSRLFDTALEQACLLPEAYASQPMTPEAGLLLVFRSYDRVTGNPAQPKSIVLGVAHDAQGFQLLKDWQVLQSLNTISSTIKFPADIETAPNELPPGDKEILIQAETLLRRALPSLDIPFRQPELELLGIVASGSQTTRILT